MSNSPKTERDSPLERRTLLELRQVYLRSDRGETVFGDLNFRLDSGQSTIIVGPAGSGKSMFADLLLGYRFPLRGVIELFGETTQPGKNRVWKRVRRKIGGVGGRFALVPTLTIEENIALPLIIAGDRSMPVHARVSRCLTEYGITKLARQYPDSLARVENTLVQLARASVANQPLILIDEPAAGLDVRTYELVCDHLIRLSVSGRALLLLVSELPPREIVGSQVYHLRDGALA